MSTAFPITKDLPELIAQWYETAEEGDIALIEGSGIVLTRTEDGVLGRTQTRNLSFTR